MRPRAEQPAPGAGHGDVGGPALLVFLLRLQVLLEVGQDAVELRQDRRVAAELEVHRLPALRRVVLDRGAGEQAFRHAGHEDVVEFQSLRGVDRHDLHGVFGRRLHRRPLLLVHALHRVHVVQERAERQLALDRFERVHLVHERREVALGGGRRDLVGVRVQLRQDAGAPDDLAQELADGLAGFDAKIRQLSAELLEPDPRVVRESLHLVEMLERLGEQERRRFALLLVLQTERVALQLRERRHARQVLVADAVPWAEQDLRERHARERIADGARVREDLDDLGQPQQSGEPQDLRRDLVFGERLLQREEQPARPAEHRDVRPLGPASCSSRMRSAIHSASFHSSEIRATCTSPVPFSIQGTSCLSGSGRCCSGSFEITTSAASRIQAPERKFV